MKARQIRPRGALEGAVRRVALATFLLTLALSGVAVADPSGVVQSGAARFEVLTPTLIRLEYAADGAFEDRPTQTAMHRDAPVPRFTVSHDLGTLTIDTGALQLHYVEGSGPFTPANVSLDVAGTTAHPAWDPCQQAPACPRGAPGGTDPTAIGGYTREAVSVNDTFPALHPGLLRTTGWYLLDDTGTAVRTGPRTAAARPLHLGPYQDGYLFGYGHDYARGLADLAALTGAAPLLPRWAFGPWFSRYFAYSDADYRTKVIPAFRAHRTPVDGLVVDTDFKAPDRWNGWDWNHDRFPDPKGFLDWAAGQGLHVVLNVHPSIDSTDPHFAAAQARAHGKLATSSGDCQFYRQDPPCYVFDWGDPDQAAAYFDLHRPFADQGVSAFWLDWCCDASTVSTPGLTPDSWVNELYAQDARERGRRGFVLTRIGSGIYDANPAEGDVTAPASGAWSDHRSAVAFTGDATSDFPTLAFEAQLTPAEGAAIGLPYLSNDIGGYTGGHLPDDLYLRWLALGVFSPVMRLHSDHGDRLPWEYDSATEAPAERFLRLREALVPYLYDTAEQAHRTGLPMSRAMVLGWPGEPGAAGASDQWMLGDDLLVAPVVAAGTSRTLWLPPGRWTDFFTGRVLEGPATVTVDAPLDRAPVYVRAGGIVPLAPPLEHVGSGPVDPLTLRVAPGASGRSSLYEDAGDGLAYEHGEAARTPLRYDGGRLVIGPVSGTYPGASKRRAYVVQFLAGERPSAVSVDGRRVAAGRDDAPLDMTATEAAAPARDGWSYDPATRTVTVRVVPRSVHAALAVALG